MAKTEAELYDEFLFEQFTQSQSNPSPATQTTPLGDDDPMLDFAPTEKKPTGPMDIFKGAMETAGTFLTGATTGTLGTVGGAIKGAVDVAFDPELDYGTQEAATHIGNTASDWGGMGTYEPKTELGRGYVETLGDAMGPLEAVEPMMVGGGATNVARRGANKNRLAATRAFEDPQNRVDAGDRIVSDDRGVPMYTSNDAQSRTAMARLGIPPEMMNQFKYASPETRQAMIQMIERGQARINDSELPNARSVMGDYIGGRASLAQTAMQKHGAALDQAAKTRQGTHVLTDDISTKYHGILEQNRIKVDADGNLDFTGRSIPADSQAKLNEIHAQVKQFETDGYADFDQLHKYKQDLSEMADYDRKSGGGADGVQQVVKGLRSQINETLRANADDYAKANDGYAEIASPMRKILKKAGDNVDDLTDAEVVERFSLQARGLTNNTQGGIDLKASMEAINKAIKNNADMFTPEDLKAAGMSDGGNVNVNLQKLADLGAYTDRLMPDKPTSFGVLTSDAAKSAMPTKSGLIEDIYQGVVTMAKGGDENRALKEAAKKRKEMEAGLEGLLGVLGRKY